MTRPRQSDLFEAPRTTVVETVKAEGVTYEFHEFSGEGCEPGPEPNNEMSRWFNHPDRRWGEKGSMSG